MSDNPRIDELKRRVQQDPASIAFAALADEYRRAGMFHDAVETCRAGLQRHPAYVSARVTLGRSLVELGEFEEARQHLEQVLRSAPENLAAIRALADIHRRNGEPLESAIQSAVEASSAAQTAAKPEASSAPDCESRTRNPRYTGRACRRDPRTRASGISCSGRTRTGSPQAGRRSCR